MQEHRSSCSSPSPEAGVQGGLPGGGDNRDARYADGSGKGAPKEDSASAEGTAGGKSLQDLSHSQFSPGPRQLLAHRDIW